MGHVHGFAAGRDGQIQRFSTHGNALSNCEGGCLYDDDFIRHEIGNEEGCTTRIDGHLNRVVTYWNTCQLAPRTAVDDTHDILLAVYRKGEW